jgi:hypothetical protein
LKSGEATSNCSPFRARSMANPPTGICATTAGCAGALSPAVAAPPVPPRRRSVRR